MNRALKEQDSDAWINGRRRDHGAERAALPVWEGKKLNPLAFWSFEVRPRDPSRDPSPEPSLETPWDPPFDP